jgi:hypothetical protein
MKKLYMYKCTVKNAPLVNERKIGFSVLERTFLKSADLCGNAGRG